VDDDKSPYYPGKLGPVAPQDQLIYESLWPR
jgi:hypothetical protein